VLTNRPLKCMLLSTGVNKDDNKPPTTAVSKVIEAMPGIAVASLVMLTGFKSADLLGDLYLNLSGISSSKSVSPVSGISMSILIGALINNTVGLPKILKPGLAFSSVTILRAGIVALGAKLSLMEVLNLGYQGIPVILLTVGTGLCVIPMLNNIFGRLSGQPDTFVSRKMGLLIAAGSSICGVTAISALAPAIKANQADVSYAVANVVMFGTIGMLTYPYLAHYFLFPSPSAVGETSERIGMFLGLAVHDTSQVIGSALTYSQLFENEAVMKVATVTKLTRNTMLAVAIPALTWWSARHEVDQNSDTSKSKLGISKIFPSFILGFLGVSLIRSIGDHTLLTSTAENIPGLALGFMDKVTWTKVYNTLGTDVSQTLLGTAMAAVGSSTDFSSVRKAGFKPLILGMSSAIIVGATGYGLITALV
jgi:uncharacterized integral membrane protein (TIGR00698 family)